MWLILVRLRCSYAKVTAIEAAHWTNEWRWHKKGKKYTHTQTREWCIFRYSSFLFPSFSFYYYVSSFQFGFYSPFVWGVHGSFFLLRFVASLSSFILCRFVYNKQIRFTYRIPFSLYGARVVVYALVVAVAVDSFFSCFRLLHFHFFCMDFFLLLKSIFLSLSCVEYVP